ncbi:MAG: hypothetical protein LBD41_03430 [Clostridiales Family XIII bacterium]|jgi:hypothetical protein|nr:hypothetical protein [Clostridiales Family XIII bacterium]
MSKIKLYFNVEILIAFEPVFDEAEYFYQGFFKSLKEKEKIVFLVSSTFPSNNFISILLFFFLFLFLLKKSK